MAVEFNPSNSFSINRNLTTASEQISNGRRINAASDDVAGVGIAVNINTQIRSQDSAITNAISGVSLVQTAQAGLSQVGDGLQQLRQLSLQASNGILSGSDRSALQTQADQLLLGIQELLTNTRFNGLQPLSQQGTTELQIGASSADRFSIPSRDIAGALEALGLNGIDLTDPNSFGTTLEALDQSLELVTTTAAEFGASENRLSSSIGNLEQSNQNQAGSVSRIEDADIAKSISELIRNQLLERTQIALQAQANSQRGQVLSLLNI
ncbi:MAG: flagellin [Halopseudomonas sp.]